MVMDYTWFYVEANIVSIILFVMMFLKEAGSVGRQSKQLIFFQIIIAHIMYFLSDICWALILGDYLPKIYFVVTLVNILNAIILSAITGLWFIYVELSQGEEYIKKSKNRLCVLVPAMLSALIMIVLFLFFPKTMLTEDNPYVSDFSTIFWISPRVTSIATTLSPSDSTLARVMITSPV